MPPRQKNVLGLLTVKAQETGISVDDLMNSVQKNDATFKSMGLNLGQSITLLAQFEQNGVNADTVMAEKAGTILSRSIFNTRPRDFYDVYILGTTQKCLEPMQELCDAYRVAVKDTDKRFAGQNIQVEFYGDLREKQIKAVEKLRLFSYNVVDMFGRNSGYISTYGQGHLTYCLSPRALH